MLENLSQSQNVGDVSLQKTFAGQDNFFLLKLAFISRYEYVVASFDNGF